MLDLFGGLGNFTLPLPLPLARRAGHVVGVQGNAGLVARARDNAVRNAGFLVRGRGYVLKAAGAMDMFPHTAHVEALALFEK